MFVYPSGKDSVLHVTQDDYAHCNTAASLAMYNDGHTVFQLNHSGPFYFISGVEEHCLKNEKLVVVVLADRSNASSSSAPTPSGPTDIIPLVPSPAPAGQEYPSPPEGSVEIVPAPAPEGEEPSPSGASMVFISTFMGSIGVLVGSSLLLF